MTPRYYDYSDHEEFIFLGQHGNDDLYYRNRILSPYVMIMDGHHLPRICYFNDPLEVLSLQIIEAIKRAYQMGLIR